MSFSKTVLRWIFALPLAVLIYVGTNFSFSFTFSFLLPDIIHGLTVPNLGGHYILGSIMLFTRETLALGLAVYTLIYIIPRGKTLLYCLSFVLWGLFVLLISIFFTGIISFITICGYIWEPGFILSSIVVSLAQLTGFIFAGVALFISKKNKNEQSNSKNH